MIFIYKMMYKINNSFFLYETRVEMLLSRFLHASRCATNPIIIHITIT